LFFKIAPALFRSPFRGLREVLYLILQIKIVGEDGSEVSDVSLDEKRVVDTRDCAVDIKDKSDEPKEIGSPTKGRDWERDSE